MATGNISVNGAAAYQAVSSDHDSVHIAVAGTFDGATVAVEQEINGIAYPLLDQGVAITFSAAADVRLNVVAGDKIRLNASGGGGSMSIDFNIAGAKLVR